MAILYHTYQVAYSRNGIDWFWYPSNDKTNSYSTLAGAEAAALFCRTSIANYSRIYSIRNLASPITPDETWIVHQGRRDGPILGKGV